MNTTVLNTLGPSGVLYRFIIPYTDLSAATGTTNTINLLALPKGSFIKGVRIKHSTAFSGGNTTATVSVGSSAGSATTFAAAFDIYQAVADTTAQMTGGWKAATYAADTLQAFFTVSTNCSLLTAGTVLIDVEIWLEPDLTATGPFGVGGTAGAPSIGGQL
jgi:hypothetical protein